MLSMPIALVLAMLFPPDAPQELRKPPTPQEQREWIKKVKETYKDSYLSGDPLLSAKLIKAAKKAKDLDLRFVLLTEARDAAIIQVDVKRALQALLRIHRQYAVDDIKMVNKLLSDTRRRARTQEQLKKFLNAVLELAKAGAEKKVDPPKPLTGAVFLTEHPSEWIIRALNEAEQMAKYVKQSGTAGQIRTFISRLERKRDAELAVSVLEYKEDANARTQYGYYLGFDLNDWKEALPHLAKGDDKALASLAKWELGVKKDAPGFEAVGDAWLKASRKRKKEEPSLFRARALDWYRKAVSEAPVLEKRALRSKMIDALRGRDGMLDLFPIIDTKNPERTKDAWWIENGALFDKPREGGLFSHIVIPYVPPSEYDLHLVVERIKGNHFLHVGLTGGGRRFQLILDSSTNYSGLDGVDGKGAGINVTKFQNTGKLLLEATPQKIECSVRRGSVTIKVGGKKIINWKADWDNVKLENTPHDRALYLRTRWTKWRISEIKIRRFSKDDELLD